MRQDSAERDGDGASGITPDLTPDPARGVTTTPRLAA